MKKGGIKTAVRWIVMPIISICSFIIVAYLCFSITLLNSSSLINSMSTTNYYDKFANKLSGTMSQTCMTFDMQPSVIQEHINGNIVKTEMTLRVNNFYKQMPYEEKARFYQFEEYLAQRLEQQTGEKISDETKSNIMGLTVTLESIWMSSMKLPIQNLLQFLQFNAKPQLQMYALVAAILLAACCVISLKAADRLSELISWLSFPVLGAGLSCILSGILFFATGVLDLMPSHNLAYLMYTHWVNKLPILMILVGIVLCLAIIFANFLRQSKIEEEAIKNP